jgi:hypothetical protein
MAQFAGILTAALFFVILFETDILESGIMAGADSQVEFAILTVMELLTIGCIPLALRLLKFKKIEADLQERHEEALLKWGVLRLSMLEVPLILNTICYYLFLNTSFGYMAIIVMLTMPFVCPTKARCDGEAHLNEEEKEA